MLKAIVKITTGIAVGVAGFAVSDRISKKAVKDYVEDKNFTKAAVTSFAGGVVGGAVSYGGLYLAMSGLDELTSGSELLETAGEVVEVATAAAKALSVTC